MLPQRHRLTRDKDFEKVAKQGRACFTGALGIKYIKNNLETSRFGIVVSLKISKKANKRNKIRRRLREIVRKKIPKIEPGYDIMILTHPPILELNFSQMEERLTKLFERARLLC